MPILTAVILAAFAAYAAAWYVGVIQGNFALLLFLATVVTGLYWLGERFVFLPRRRAAALSRRPRARRRADGGEPRLGGPRAALRLDAHAAR